MFDISPKGILSLIKQGESNNVEFTARLPAADIIAKVIASFANTDGGILLIGIEDNGNIRGLSNDELYPTIKRINKVVSSLLPEPVDMGTVEVHGKIILYVIVSRVPEHQLPIMSSNGKVFQRKDDQTISILGASVNCHSDLSVSHKNKDIHQDALEFDVLCLRDEYEASCVSSLCVSSLLTNVGSIEQPEWYEVLHDELNRLPIGKIVFNPPDVMRLGVKDRIETRITRDIKTNLLASLKGRGIPQSDELKISELMKVRLSGNDFNIVSLNEEEQVIEKTGFTEWAWDVTPNKSGKKVLHLHVTLRIRLPFGEERKDHPILDREIVVKVNPVYSLKKFLISYWKWIVTALILPLIGLIWKIYTK